MDKIQDVSEACDLYPSLSIIGMVYDSTTKNCGLRRFCVQMLLCKIFSSSSGIGVRTDYENSVGDLAQEVHELGSKNLDFFQDYIAWAMIGNKDKYFADPRVRDETDPKDRCYYHCHKKSTGNCHLDNPKPRKRPDFTNDGAEDD